MPGFDSGTLHSLQRAVVWTLKPCAGGCAGAGGAAAAADATVLPPGGRAGHRRPRLRRLRRVPALQVGQESPLHTSCTPTALPLHLHCVFAISIYSLVVGSCADMWSAIVPECFAFCHPRAAWQAQCREFLSSPEWEPARASAPATAAGAHQATDCNAPSLIDCHPWTLCTEPAICIDEARRSSDQVGAAAIAKMPNPKT